jgi:hypothetical protein
VFNDTGNTNAQKELPTKTNCMNIKEYTAVGVVNEDFDAPIYIDIIEATSINQAIKKR